MKKTIFECQYLSDHVLHVEPRADELSGPFVAIHTPGDVVPRCVVLNKKQTLRLVKRLLESI